MSRIVQDLLGKGEYRELKYLDIGRTDLMYGLLMTSEGCITPDPPLFQKLGEDFNEIYVIFEMGSRLTGHHNVLHGGALATLLDETMCFCGFAMLPHKVGVTANLNIDYCAPSPANSKVLVHARTSEVIGRKVWVEAATYVVNDEMSLADLANPTMKAKLLAIEPKWYKELTL